MFGSWEKEKEIFQVISVPGGKKSCVEGVWKVHWSGLGGGGCEKKFHSSQNAVQGVRTQQSKTRGKPWKDKAEKKKIRQRQPPQSKEKGQLMTTTRPKHTAHPIGKKRQKSGTLFCLKGLCWEGT